MNRIILITILLTGLTTTRTNSQNIYSALHLNRDEDFKVVVPTEVVEENVFFNSSGKESKKNKKKLNSKKKVLIEERFDQDGKLEARLTYAYDSSGLHSLTRKFERWTNYGYSSETAFYEYDVNWFLVRVTDKTDKGNVIQETVLANNVKGDPTRLELLDGKGNLYGIETATYDYKANQAYTQVLDSRGNPVSRDTLIIDFNVKRDSPHVYNDNGDLIQSSEYFYEYKYDEFGNWTTMKIFENVQGKKKNDRNFKRRLTYHD